MNEGIKTVFFHTPICKQSHHILRFGSMYALTIGECEDLCVKICQLTGPTNK